MILTVVAAAPPSKEVETAVGIAHTDADTPKAPAVLSRNDADADGTVGGTAESSESTLVAAVLPVVSDCPSRNDVETAVIVADADADPPEAAADLPADSSVGVATAVVLPAVNAVMGCANSSMTAVGIAHTDADTPKALPSFQGTMLMLMVLSAARLSLRSPRLLRRSCPWYLIARQGMMSRLPSSSRPQQSYPQ